MSSDRKFRTMTVPRATLILLTALLLPVPCLGSSEYGGSKGLAEVAKMKGVKVVFLNERIQSFGTVSNATPLVEVYFAWTPENDLLGKGGFTGIRNVLLGGVELHLRDQTGDTLAVTPVRTFESDSLDGFLALADSGLKRGTLICFSIDKRMIKHSFLRFNEMVTHGTQWTDVYFGGEPIPSRLPPLPKKNRRAPKGPIQAIPGLELPPGAGRK